MTVDPTKIRTHDLVRILPAALLLGNEQENIPDWVKPSLEKAPFVVVRRAKIVQSTIPIGVRGTERHQRWGGFINVREIKEVVSPEALVERFKTISPKRIHEIPAFRMLVKLTKQLHGSDWIWGPTGSIGFELACGIETAKITSDLDLILRCDTPISKAEAAKFLKYTLDFDAKVDILIETPIGAVAMQEFINSDAPFAVRTNSEPILMTSPWAKDN